MPRFFRVVLIFGVALGALLVWAGLQRLAFAGPPAGPIDQLSNFAAVFLGLFVEAAPFLLLGTLASGLVEVFVGQDDLSRLLPRDPIRGAVVGGLMGLFFPVCECGVVPLARRLFRKGLPVSSGVAFLLAAPVFNPIVIASTLAAFGWGRMLFLRVGLTLIIAIAIGWVFAAQNRPERLLRPQGVPLVAGASGRAIAAAPGPRRAGLRQVLTIAADEFFEMGRYLIIGSLIAALVQTILPQSALLKVSAGPLVSVLALIALAVILSVGSTVDAFTALAFAGAFTRGSVLAFLVFGPMVDIKSTLMYLGVFRRRVVLYLILLLLMMTILAAVYINLSPIG